MDNKTFKDLIIVDRLILKFYQISKFNKTFKDLIIVERLILKFSPNIKVFLYKMIRYTRSHIKSSVEIV